MQARILRIVAHYRAFLETKDRLDAHVHLEDPGHRHHLRTRPHQMTLGPEATSFWVDAVIGFS
jgi:hypothetical protein